MQNHNDLILKQDLYSTLCQYGPREKKIYFKTLDEKSACLQTNTPVNKFKIFSYSAHCHYRYTNQIRPRDKINKSFKSFMKKKKFKVIQKIHKLPVLVYIS